MLQTFELAYGHGETKLSISKDNLLGIIQALPLPSLSHTEQAVKEALRSPIESPPLVDLISPRERVGIVVSDKTRISNSNVLVPAIVEELLESGVLLNNIFVVFATGTHLSHTKKEQEAIVGPRIVSQVRLFDHDCRQRSNLQYIGTTTRGTRIEINQHLLEVDRIILTGVITYHYFAGFGGGRKSILPGVASFETIQANHRLLLNPEPGTGMNPMAKTGVLYGNPIHEDMEEAAMMVSPDFLVNVVLDDQAKIAAIFAGDYILAHGRGCDFLDEHYRVNIDVMADVVIAGGGGYPKDMNFVQSHKAMDNAAYALKDGGTMILVAESAGGFPSSVYEKWIDLGSSDAIEEGLRNGFSIPGHTVYAAVEKAKRFNVIWVSKQDPKKIEKMGITPAWSVDEALALVQQKLGDRWKAYVMPNAYVTFPNQVS